MTDIYLVDTPAIDIEKGSTIRSFHRHNDRVRIVENRRHPERIGRRLMTDENGKSKSVGKYQSFFVEHFA